MVHLLNYQFSTSYSHDLPPYLLLYSWDKTNYHCAGFVLGTYSHTYRFFWHLVTTFVELFNREIPFVFSLLAHFYKTYGAHVYATLFPAKVCAFCRLRDNSCNSFPAGSRSVFSSTGPCFFPGLSLSGDQATSVYPQQSPQRDNLFTQDAGKRWSVYLSDFMAITVQFDYPL